MAFLKGISKEVEGKVFPVEGEELTIGRHEDNEVAVPETSVSGKHFRILRDGRRYMLEDLGSTNGTCVNGVEVTETQLKAKDVIKAGSVEFLFDGQDIEAPEGVMGTRRLSMVPERVVRTGGTGDGVAVPETFGVRRDSRGVWTAALVLLGVAALAGLGLLMWRVFFAG